jgi:hypothetical protein
MKNDSKAVDHSREFGRAKSDPDFGHVGDFQSIDDK